MNKLKNIYHSLTQRGVYQKLSNTHRIALLAAYALLIAIGIAALYTVGSRVKTRTYPAGFVTLTTPSTRYITGEEITFSVQNNYNSTIYITNNCPTEPLEVYKLLDNKWQRQHATTSGASCKKQDRRVAVAPGAKVTGSFKPWQSLFAQPGRYRIVAYVDFYRALPYRDFEIIDKPAVPAIPALLPKKVVAQTTPAQTKTSTSSNNTTSSAGTNTTPGTTDTAPTRQSKTISLSVGTVVVEYTSTTIYVMSVTPAAGYTYEGGGSGRTIEITFKGSGQETQLQLSLRNGQITQRVESGG